MAQVSLAAPDAGVAEAERAVKKLGALGVQIYTNVAGKPLDRPEYLPFWDKMNELGAPVWMHPTRGAETPDYIAEEKSLYEIWWTFGWSYETATAMARLVFSKIIDTHPNLKIITHHFGGIVPMLEGRLGPGNDVLGSRTSDADYVSLRKSLKKRVLDYFKQDFWADTAVFTAEPATKAGMEFFPRDKIVFASDCPFDPEGGTMYPRETLRILDWLNLSKADQRQDLLQESRSGHRPQIGEVVTRAVIARSQRVRPEVAGPMTGSADEGQWPTALRPRSARRDAFSRSLDALCVSRCAGAHAGADGAGHFARNSRARPESLIGISRASAQAWRERIRRVLRRPNDEASGHSRALVSAIFALRHAELFIRRLHSPAGVASSNR